MSAITDSITTLAQALVKTPSQGGIDAPDSVLQVTRDFARGIGLEFTTLQDAKGNDVALVAKIDGAHPGKTWAVNATLDTAPIGNKTQWNSDPFSGEIKDGHLLGRGAADSKLAAAMFTHLANEMQALKQDMHGSLLLILDADEHTGNFGGIKAVLAAGYKPDGIMIGYSGDDQVIVGSRGFSRYEIELTGKAAHSGASAAAEDNALLRLSAIVQALTKQQPHAQDDVFQKQPKLTVTEVSGGDGYAVVPSKAVIKVDMRLTPAFNEAAADKHIRNIVARNDKKNKVPEGRATKITKISAEPPFLTPPTSEMRQALRAAIKEITGEEVKEAVSGPSNIGNFMAKQGIEVTAGYGVPASGIHAANEKADLRALPKIYNVYKRTLGALLRL
ncbi:MAG: M20/M25/M40 family metallo-hydrolase [bacterium]|nr:M20/M25/M40 family metallo-hydrolase [bacterium]